MRITCLRRSRCALPRRRDSTDSLEPPRDQAEPEGGRRQTPELSGQPRRRPALTSEARRSCVCACDEHARSRAPPCRRNPLPRGQARSRSRRHLAFHRRRESSHSPDLRKGNPVPDPLKVCPCQFLHRDSLDPVHRGYGHSQVLLQGCPSRCRRLSDRLLAAHLQHHVQSQRGWCLRHLHRKPRHRVESR